jgi:hypothetical protein
MSTTTPTFASTDEMYGIVTPYLQSLTTDDVVGPKFVAANTSFRVQYTNPDGCFLLDATHNPAVLTTGEAAQTGAAEVALTMSADDGHKFWLGDLNLPIALARRKLKIDGPVTKLFGLLPALQPAYAKYKEHLAAIGRPELL